jgi:1-deoxy-D-xylulose-5-phosphate reductoisomerase
MSMRRGIAILGSTGSIGRSTLAVIALHPEAFKVAVLGAFSSWQVIVEQAKTFHPDVVVLVDEEAAAKARAALRDCGSATKVESGAIALSSAVSAPDVHMVMAAIVGAAGLQSTLAAVRAGKRVFLANKEALVMTGRLLMDEVRRAGAELIPIDSEHNAIFQCMPAGYLPGNPARGVTRVILTASGGPFRSTTAEKMERVTPDEACAHPKWKMGRKISVDSATLMNKGLEVIEAHWLFGASAAEIDVVIHPQSVVHSMVEFTDGSTMAQCSPPDMRLPIALGLGWPDRVPEAAPGLDWSSATSWEFFPLDDEAFPAVELAREVGHRGATYPAVYNAANEVCVGDFLAGRLPFSGILDTVASVVRDHQAPGALTVDSVLEADRWARNEAAALNAAPVGSGNHKER